MKSEDIIRFLRKIFLIIFFTAVTNFSLVTKGYSLEQNGTYTYDYSSDLNFFRSNKDELIKKAKVEACKDALNRYILTFTSSKQTNYEKVKDQIQKRFSEIVTCNNVVDEKEDVKKMEYSVVVKTLINTNLMDNIIGSTAAINKVKEDDKSEMATIFFTRTVSKAKIFDDKVTKASQGMKGKDISQTEAVSDGDVKISSETNTSEMSSTGGNTEVKAAQYTYIVSDEDNSILMGGMSDILSESNYALIEADQIDAIIPLLKLIKSGYANSNEFNPKARNDIYRVLKNEKIPYLFYGIFDVGQPEKDAATGNIIVNVTLTKATLVDLKRERVRDVGSVSDLQQKGQGTTYKQAKASAISGLSKQAAKIFADKLNAKGVN